MAEVKKSDFIYFQNEFLQDIKKLDVKFNEKISQLMKTFQNNKLVTEQKFEIFNNKLSSLLTSIESNSESKKIKTELEDFKKRITQENISISNKIFYLERDLSDACFKYDNLFSTMGAPGLIGKGCKYINLKTFFELTDKNVIEFQSFRDKNKIDLEKYKNKLETLIGQFKLQIDSSKDKYFSFCNDKILETKNEINEQFRLIDEKINNMRLENGKYTYELIQKTEELKEKFEIINNITNEVDEKLYEQMKKYQKYNNELVKTFDSHKEEFKTIKIRFTELSEYIKDVRFLRNIKNYNNLKGNSKDNDYNSLFKTGKLLSKKLNFNKNQKITEEEENIFYNKQNNNDIINIINSDDNKINVENKEENNNKIKFDNKDDYKNNKIIDNKKNANDNKNIANNIDEDNKKKYNLKLKDKDNSNSKINLNLSNINNNINNNNSKNSLLKENKYNNTSLSPNKSRNLNLNKEVAKTDINLNKKTDYLKTDESLQSTINQNYKKSLFIRAQSQFSLQNNIKRSEYKMKIQKTQDNFYNKKKILSKNQLSLENNSSNPKNYSVESGKKFKKIWEKERNFDELLKLLENNNSKNNNYLYIEAYRFLNQNIIKNDEKIKEIVNITKINFDKINKKIQMCQEVTNSLLIKIKMGSLQKRNIDINSPKHIYINSEINIPLINKGKNDNYDLTSRNKIKKNIENITLKHKKISSGKLLSIIEPYLIKKFKSN